MKRFFKLSFLALFVTVVSCEDATDIIQDSELSEENAFRNLEDLQSGLLGVYGAYTPDAGSNGIGDAIFFSDVFTDNVKSGLNNNGQGSEEFNFTLQPGSNSARIIYGNRYATINFANRILRAWDRIAPGLTSDADIAEANEIKAQLLALRALAHFDILQYFVEDYTDDASTGIQILNFVPQLNQTVPRSTVGESFDFIRTDLEEAQDLFESVDVPGGSFFINDDVVTALRARVALFEGDYTLAEQLSDEILTSGYGLDKDAFVSLWTADDVEGNPEVIFALSRQQGDNGIASNWYTNSVDIDGAVLLEMSNQLFNLYQTWDIRAYGEAVYIADTDALSDGIILIGKYPGGNSRGQLVNHVKALRTAEIVLIKAECQARRGDYAGATATIQALWDERVATGEVGAPNVPALTSATALRQVLEERRKELAFEGHRYLDLKRLGRELGIGISRNPEDCASFNTTQCGLASTDYRWTLPIPTTETNANPTIVQNTGY